MDLDQLRGQLEAAASEIRSVAARIADAGEDADVDALRTDLETAEAEHARIQGQIELAEAAERARAAHPEPVEPSRATPDPEETPARVTEEPMVYRSRSEGGEHSFFVDLSAARSGDSGARERLTQHAAQMRDRGEVEKRAIGTSGSPGGAGIIPPIYLRELVSTADREGRTFANTLATLPLPDEGMTVTIPVFTPATTPVTSQDPEASAITNTDPDTSQITSPVRTVAGEVVISRQLFDRSGPEADRLIMTDLMDAKDEELDRQLIAADGTAGTLTGILNVSGVNAVSFTGSTVEALVGTGYDAARQIRENRKRRATDILAAPRRAAWIAAGFSANDTIFRQGGFGFGGVGEQDRGRVLNWMGLPVHEDGNVPEDLGTGTDEDRLVFYRGDDLFLMEGPDLAQVEDVTLRSNLQVKITLWCYVAAVLDRKPGGISVISGTGLTPPTF